MYTILTHARPETLVWCTFKLWEKRGMKYASLSPLSPSACVYEKLRPPAPPTGEVKLSGFRN